MDLSSKKESGLMINTRSLHLYLRVHPGNFSPLGPESSLKQYTAQRCVGKCAEGRPINSHVGKALKLPLFLAGPPCSVGALCVPTLELCPENSYTADYMSTQIE